MDEEKEVRFWALAALFFVLPAGALGYVLISLYLLGGRVSWFEFAATLTGPLGLILVILSNPKPFTRSVARERRKELRENRLSWLAVATVIGMILLVWAASVAVVRF